MRILFILLMNVNHIHQPWGLESNNISNKNFDSKYKPINYFGIYFQFMINQY
jgi:hypothetical protein